MTRLTSTALLLIGLSACAKTGSTPIQPQPKTQLPSAGVARAKGQDSIELWTPSPTPDEPTLRDATAALTFVRELCEAAKEENWQYVEAHAQLPLRGQEQVGKQEEPLLVGGLVGEEKPGQILNRAVCKYLPESTRALNSFRVSGEQVQGVVKLNGHDYRLSFALHPPRLVEQKLLIPSQPPGPLTTEMELDPHPIVIAVSERGKDRSTNSFLSRLVKDELERNPTCAKQQAVREPVGLSMGIDITTGPEQTPQIELNASTVTDARFIACLQSQLVPVLEHSLADSTDTKHYELWTMIGIAVDDDEIQGPAVISF